MHLPEQVAHLHLADVVPLRDTLAVDPVILRGDHVDLPAVIVVEPHVL